MGLWNIQTEVRLSEGEASDWAGPRGISCPSQAIQRAHTYLHVDGENAVWPRWVFVHRVRGYNPIGFSLKKRKNVDNILRNLSNKAFGLFQLHGHLHRWSCIIAVRWTLQANPNYKLVEWETNWSPVLHFHPLLGSVHLYSFLKAKWQDELKAFKMFINIES